VALQLRKHGIRRVRPLLGGFHEWKSLGFPLVEISELDTSSPSGNAPSLAQGSA
jgi:3-mercaptopyruvate sulfurtransferase SseA